MVSGNSTGPRSGLSVGKMTLTSSSATNSVNQIFFKGEKKKKLWLVETSSRYYENIQSDPIAFSNNTP